MRAKLVPRRYDRPSLGSPPSAAALAQVPASSLLSAPRCAGVHQTAKELLSLVIRSPNSRMVVARRYPGHILSERMRSTADAESEKMVYGPPLASRWSAPCRSRIPWRRRPPCSFRGKRGGPHTPRPPTRMLACGGLITWKLDNGVRYRNLELANQTLELN